jgi:hypothetical protein
MDHSRHQGSSSSNGKISRARWVFIAFMAIAAYFLIAEHKAHLSGLLYYWPFLLVLACPLLHVFMHGGHGGHTSGGDHKHDSEAKGDRN